MIPYNQVINGVTKYIDAEIVAKIGGWQKWVLGTGLGIAMTKGEVLFEQMKTMPLIKMLGIIDDANMVDIDTIYTELKKQAEKEPITVALPMVGTLTLTYEDVDKLYSHITGGGIV